MPMYIPRQFQEDRRAVLAQAVRDIQLATLVTPGPDGLQVTHLPVHLVEDGDAWILAMHVARPNPHGRLSGPTVAIFQGPHAYVSPSFYPSKQEHGRFVPTWNYIAVHLHGVLEPVEDEAWLHAQLDALTDHNEGNRAQPWAVADAPADYMAGMLRGIVGLRMRVDRVDAAWKMIQHRSEADRLGTIAGLAAAPEGQEVAALMQGLEAARE